MPSSPLSIPRTFVTGTPMRCASAACVSRPVLMNSSRRIWPGRSGGCDVGTRTERITRRGLVGGRSGGGDVQDVSVAQASVRRKGLRSLARAVAVLALAGVAAIPVTAAVAAIATPVLWRLEPRLGIELAGHSGPSDWLLAAIFLVTTGTLTVAALAAMRGSPTAANQSDAHAGGDNARPAGGNG